MLINLLPSSCNSLLSPKPQCVPTVHSYVLFTYKVIIQTHNYIIHIAMQLNNCNDIIDRN